MTELSGDMAGESETWSGHSKKATTELIQIHRGCADLRAGRPLIVRSGSDAVAVLAVDGLDQTMLDTFRQDVAAEPPHLLVTDRRAAAIGLTAYEATAVSLSPNATPEDLMTLSAGSEVKVGHTTSPGGTAEEAALEIAKCAELLPALIAAPVHPDAASLDPTPLVVNAETALDYRRQVAETLKMVAEAPVPLRGDIDSRFIVFRDIMGGTAVAVMVGQPDPKQPLRVRVHSACATGDIFGSRRCDCGDQLRLALERIDQLGGGCVVYLDQEGRGLGLANKLRAYNLQDLGLDTVDANTALGYHEDERDYTAAGRIVSQLGWRQIVLLTNNPTKIDALRAAGIEVSGRIPVLAPVNAENRRYLEAKAARAGHFLDQLGSGDGPVAAVSSVKAGSRD
ncbi:GTP cyclohydrolase II RibA [Amorphus orientalis]|uniref:GTP cyclohydrolase-2 n=1 Tax=Amorphus orientalis TaxID=649198 RepID=A0AAE3VQP0_9HYPH|nr:GTP cyclohydrolase II RibA [Amorphus orientalis]MDQ0315996.1 GTP cyclohydrolase II [Amorphus orientalis]